MSLAQLPHSMESYDDPQTLLVPIENGWTWLWSACPGSRRGRWSTYRGGRGYAGSTRTRSIPGWSR